MEPVAPGALAEPDPSGGPPAGADPATGGGVRVRFLLGPAGSGKTHRCLREIADELRRDPEGPPLLLLAPKQATFQLERRLLEEEGLAGWTRLQVLSFERLAQMTLADSGPVSLLDEEGRVMVLRAMLRWHQPRLRVFRAAARLTGFARELSGTLRELQRHRVGPERLEALAVRSGIGGALGNKLHDLALLLRAYHEWLRDHGLQDVDLLPDLATERLNAPGAWRFGGVWMDGFAEMTPQEVELLAAIVRRARAATVAFCVAGSAADPAGDVVAWLSPWSLVSHTFRRCHARLAALPGAEVRLEVLPVPGEPGRFADRPALAHLERGWSAATEAQGEARALAGETIRLVACRDFEREAEVAAREVWRHVRQGGRFRDVAVLVRSLGDTHDLLRQVFLRYEIPFFIDRREALAHHPAAELARAAMRLAAFGWQHEDWFAILKTGLTPAAPEAVDRIENEALAEGWSGSFWAGGEGEDEGAGAGSPLAGRFVEEIARPLRRFARALRGEPCAADLAGALRRLWGEFDVAARLEAWDEAGRDDRGGAAVAASVRLHRAAGEQLDAWLDNLERGFGTEGLPLAEWLPILEAGLATLTAGVIPPSQDQVLIGAVDRSRQPELRVALVLGMNEGRFPAPATGGGILTEADRERLADEGASLDPDRRQRVGQERYLAYIACTRSHERLVLSWSTVAEDGTRLNPSPFIGRVRQMFPDLPIATDADEAVGPESPPDRVTTGVVHGSELLPWLLAQAGPTPLDGLAGDPVRRAWLRELRAGVVDRLCPGAVHGLYGEEPEVSVSALESLASCPFQFFVHHGLRGRERDRFEVDPRRTGSLAHEILARFHADLRTEGLRWRDVSPAEARARLERVAALEVPRFGGGVFAATPEARWDAEGLVGTLGELVEVLVDWMSRYQFDPLLAEAAFGGAADSPAWRIASGDGRSLRVRGKVDRVDLCLRDAERPWFTVIDYKLSAPRLDDRLVRAGVDLQLVAYALALREAWPWRETAGATGAAPAAFVYVALRRSIERAASRAELMDEPDVRAARFRHYGRLRASAVKALDAQAGGAGAGPFSIRLNRDGSPRKGGEVRPDAEFDAMLDEARGAITALARSVFAGEAAVSPFRCGPTVACATCELGSVCRFDAAAQRFRRPRAGAGSVDGPSAPGA